MEALFSGVEVGGSEHECFSQCPVCLLPLKTEEALLSPLDCRNPLHLKGVRQELFACMKEGGSEVYFFRSPGCCMSFSPVDWESPAASSF